MVDALAGFDYRIDLPPLPATPADGSLIKQGAELAREAETMIGRSPRGVTARALAEQWEQTFGLVAAAVELPDGLDGLSWDSGDFRLILVARTHLWTRQRFTLAHELGHILAGDAVERPLAEHVTPSTDQALAEVRANAFAAELLMPRSELLETVTAHARLDKQALLSLSWEYLVSPSAMATRLHALEIISDDERRQWSACTTRMAALHTGDPGPHMQYAQQADDGWYSTRLAKLAISAYVHGDISIRLVATVTGMDPDQLLDLFHPGPDTLDDGPHGTSATSPAELAFSP
ncbi:ImmA/IrrE family metallo-endopeptidase (plasmid) [Streptomyces dangxiongensis]|uniref:ImmA/IrrE family metallo-endopeptidase n=1 Tax=Streptomyces dangxiongensis TaxID=1442032 RepID=A0A3G2J653_9ACTN|nr:ImmA/IrrE family metallo-endopeptidase [Streptomyces dangxiongensis]